MLKPALHLRVSQNLTLTPQLQQSIRLLQLATHELEAELTQALQDNPLLEREAPAAGAEPDPDHTPWGSNSGPGSGGSRTTLDDDDARQIAAPEPDLAGHLQAQLALMRLSPRDQALLTLLIGELDDNGYLSTTLEALVEWLPAELGVTLDELRAALRLLQSCDPLGVGARNLAECLVLQLPDEPGLSTEQRQLRTLARRLCADHLEALGARDYTGLQRALGCDANQLREVEQAVRRLEPRPGSHFGAPPAPYVTPDLLVQRADGRWIARANPASGGARLTLNTDYARIAAEHRDSPLAGQLREARWLLRSLQQRADTILRVGQEIVTRQQGFFEYGPIAMRPMVLRDVAEALSLHESTVSRVTAGKYLQSPRGVHELKYFFGSQVSTQGGGGASSLAVQTLIQQMIAAEDTAKPLSDQRLTELLGEQGVVVARRTVAKYREALRLPPAAQRKRLA